jgi:hypothetical protein
MLSIDEQTNYNIVHLNRQKIVTMIVTLIEQICPDQPEWRE